MMSDTFCGYDGKRDEVIVAYLYGEMAAGERTAFTRHLTRCLVCQREIDALGDLRVELAAWSAPDSIAPGGAAGDIVGHSATGSVAGTVLGSLGATRGESVVGGGVGRGMGSSGTGNKGRGRPAAGERSLRAVETGDPLMSSPVPAVNGGPERRAVWRDLPAWAQFAAAMLFLGLSAAIANFQITYDRDGLMVRTGWSDRAAVRAGADSGTGSGAVVLGTSPAEAAVTQADLIALTDRLRDQLRSEVRSEVETTMASSAVPVTGKMSKDAEDEVMRKLISLIRASEQRQQRELALRIGEVAQDAQAQRQADLVRIDRTLGALQNTTGTAVRRQEQLLNNLAVRVSQRQ
jgi:hypothetical protein